MRNNVSFKPGSNTRVFSEPELTASNALQSTFFFLLFYFPEKTKKKKDEALRLKLYYLLSGLIISSLNLSHAVF